MKVRPGALIVRDGAVLTMRYRYGHECVHVLPGGNPDPGESLVEALARELKEELGVEASVGKMVLAGEVLRFNQKEDTLHCIFLAEIAEGEIALNKAETTAQAIEWVKAEDLSAITLYPNFVAHLAELMKLPEGFSYTGPLRQHYVA